MTARLRINPMVRMAARQLLARPSRTLLTLAGIVLGVAMILAISITNRSTVESIKDLFSEAAGNAQLTVISASNDEEGFSEAIATRIRSVEGVETVSPIVSETTSLATTVVGSDQTHGMTGVVASGLLIYGIDPKADRAVRDYVISKGEYLPSDPDSQQIVVVSDWADDSDVEVGEDLPLMMADGSVRNVRVVGLMSKEGPGKLNNGAFGIMPIGAVQDLFERAGEIDTVDIVVRSGRRNQTDIASIKAAVQGRLGEDYAVIYPSTQGERVAKMLDMYQMGLSFFSGIALFVGVFLIYNAFSMTVVERTREIGMLRAVGMTKKQVRQQILTEALVMGVIGVALGVGLGILMSIGLIRVMEAVVAQEVSRVRIPAAGLLSSVLVGMVATVVAAMLPAYQAGRVSPLEALRVRGQGKDPWIIERGWPLGLGLIALSLILMFAFPNVDSKIVQGLSSVSLTMAFGACTLVIPPVASWLDRFLRWPVVHIYGNEGRLGASNVQRSRLRTALTVAALTVGISMIIAVGSLTVGFKRDINDWISTYFGGDLYIFGSLPLRADMGGRIEAISGVDTVTPLRYLEATWVHDDGTKETIQIRATDPASYMQVTEFNFVGNDRDPEELAAELAAGDALFISTLTSEQFDVSIGDAMTLQTRRGLLSFRVAGIVVDYMSQGPSVQMSWKDVRRYFGINDVQFFLAKATPGADVDAVKERITDQFGARSHLTVQSNMTFKEEASGIMDQVFGMFDVIAVIAMVVASLGVVNTLTMSVIERTREVGMLRSIGMTKKQIWRMILSEAALIGLIGGLFGLAVGLILSRLFVVGASASAGYMVNYYVPWVQVGTGVVISLVVSQVAAMLPARRAAGLRIVTAIQFE